MCFIHFGGWLGGANKVNIDIFVFTKISLIVYFCYHMIDVCREEENRFFI